MKLKEYKDKRDFSKTKEPKTSGKAHKNPIFVVQHHFARREHYDFRLEYNGVLLSWAVPKGVPTTTKDKRLAVKVEDHPISYANFSGTIPKGEYGAGVVEIFDSGTYIANQSFKSGLKEGALKFSLNGKKLKGNYALIRTQMDKKQDNWLLIKEKTSKNPFSKISVELATLLEQVPENDNDYAYEVKFDGYRIVAYIEGGEVRLESRNHIDFTQKFDSITQSLKTFFGNRSLVLDGEIIVCDENGRSDFNLLHRYLRGENFVPIYAIFDILAKDGDDLREQTYLSRKKILNQELKNCPDNLLYVTHVNGGGEKCFEFAKKNNLEGIIGKLKNSKYIGERSYDWIKIKCTKLEEFVIGGYTLSKDKSELNALLLGKFVNGKFEYVGKVGTGFDTNDKKQIRQKLDKFKRKTSPFTKKIAQNEHTVFVSPSVVVQIQFSEYTEDGSLRHPSFEGIREDKTSTELKNETSNEGDFKVKNGDKIYFPKDKITKQDLVDYYCKVANNMLFYIENRFLSVIRCPDGIKGQVFFQKHLDGKLEGIKTKNDYFYIISKQGLFSLISLGVVEFHPWCCVYDNLSRPDVIVFDLDPGDDVDLDKVRLCAKRLKKILKELTLECFIKTSGGKGYHIVVPLSQSVTWSKFEKFCKDVALLMESKWSDEYTTNIRKNERQGKIFIDYLRNKKGQTSVAPYSVRAHDGATVSVPISWSELDTITPQDITIKNIDKRLKKNPWKNYFEVKQNQKIK